MTKTCKNALRKVAARDWLDRLAGEWNTPLGFLPALFRADRDPNYLYNHIPPKGAESGKAHYPNLDDYKKYAQMRLSHPKPGESRAQTADRVAKETAALERKALSRQLDSMGNRMPLIRGYDEYQKQFGELTKNLEDFYNRSKDRSEAIRVVSPKNIRKSVLLNHVLK